MQGAPLSLILDVVILVLLGLTIVYAARLSLQLRRLRDSKSDLDRVVRDLVKNLDRADRAIAGLRETAQDSGQDLQNAIDKATALSDELQLMTDSGDRLAGRLERLVDGAKPMISGISDAPKQQTRNTASSQDYAQHLRKLDAAEEKASKLSFNIRDPEVERGIDPLDGNKMAFEDDGSGQGLYSEAERDLFRAMKGKGKAKGAA